MPSLPLRLGLGSLRVTALGCSLLFCVLLALVFVVVAAAAVFAVETVLDMFVAAAAAFRKYLPLVLFIIRVRE